jgi:Domain of unknown function (DUF4112)
MEENKTTNPQTPHTEFAMIDTISSLLDNKFRIPFTQTRFGVDFLIGLIPTAGDWLSFGISSGLVFSMLRRGIGVGMLFKMLGNISLDAAVGSIPILGDFFDLHYKANRRNVDLLKKYYVENPNPPAAKRSFFIIGILFLMVLITILIGMTWLISHLWTLMRSSI